MLQRLRANAQTTPVPPQLLEELLAHLLRGQRGDPQPVVQQRALDKAGVTPSWTQAPIVWWGSRVTRSVSHAISSRVRRSGPVARKRLSCSTLWPSPRMGTVGPSSLNVVPRRLRSAATGPRTEPMSFDQATRTKRYKALLSGARG